MRKRNSHNVIVTSLDAARLKQLLERAVINARDQGLFAKLEEELESARVVKPESVPPDVVTINSQVCVHDLDTGDDRIHTLVMPRDADAGSGKISILAPSPSRCLVRRSETLLN